jgi:hypothetical protein
MTLPTGWTIKRTAHRDGDVDFDIYEPGGPTWTDGSPRPTLGVAVYSPGRASGGRRPDKRPDVARALAVALTRAAREADQMNACPFREGDAVYHQNAERLTANRGTVLSANYRTGKVRVRFPGAMNVGTETFTIPARELIPWGTR